MNGTPFKYERELYHLKTLDNIDTTNPTKNRQDEKCCSYSGTLRVYPVKCHETKKRGLDYDCDKWNMTFNCFILFFPLLHVLYLDGNLTLHNLLVLTEIAVSTHYLLLRIYRDRGKIWIFHGRPILHSVIKKRL